MKNYTITVNGNVYNVTVEEGTTAGAAPVVSAAKAAPAPKVDPRQPHYRRRGRRLSGLFRHAAFYVCPLGRNADKSGDRPADDRHYSDHERHPQNF